MTSGVPEREVSFVLATHNRRAVALDTVHRIHACGLARSDYEIVAVDNASEDGTPEAISPQVDILIRLRANLGSCAKADGVERAAGQFIVFLDDDSYPRPDSICRMLAHFADDPGLGAAGFTVHLPDGRQEGAALPDVFLGCGVGFRAQALRQAGGLDRTFFMQAEEYDLAFRMVSSGWRVRMFDDLHVDHLKTLCARKTARTTFYDIRNNLRIVGRYLPSPYYEIYRADCLRRYAWLAERDGHGGAFARGVLTGLWRCAIERQTYQPFRLSPQALEQFYRWNYVRERMGKLADDGVRRITLADLGKNVFAYHRAALEAGIHVAAIGDDRFCAPHRHYRGVPIVGLEDALALRSDAVVVGNSSAVHGTDTYRRLRDRGLAPLHHWFGPPETTAPHEIPSLFAPETADSQGVECGATQRAAACVCDEHAGTM